MKIRGILTNLLLSGVLAISQNLFVLSSLNQAKAQSSPRPYVVFVNGWQNCCAWGMRDLQTRLINDMNAEIRYTPYSNFNDGGRSGNTSTDEQFLRDGANFINNELDRNRPLILVGHSFGGDSVLKILPRIQRRIQFVAVIDPVRTGGLRAPLSALNVPGNVDYFFNRWQNNEPFPIDFSISGSIRCNARQCDQNSQSAHTDIKGKPIQKQCAWYETCNTQQVRTGHQTLPTDDWIEKIIGDKIQQQLLSSCGNNIEIRPTNQNLTFSRGTSWETCNGYLFVFQDDGNLVLYNRARQPLWASNTRSSNPPNLLAIQTDGNMVLYRNGNPVWAVNPGIRSGAFLAIQTDGNVVLYDNSGAYWSTNIRRR